MCDFSDLRHGVPSGLLADWVQGWYLERMRLIVFQWPEGEPMSRWRFEEICLSCVNLRGFFDLVAEGLLCVRWSIG